MDGPDPATPFRGGYRVLPAREGDGFALEAWGRGLEEVLPRLLEGATRGRGGTPEAPAATLHTFVVRAATVEELVAEVVALGLRFGVVRAVAEVAPGEPGAELRVVLRAHVARAAGDRPPHAVPAACSVARTDGLLRARVEVAGSAT